VLWMVLTRGLARLDLTFLTYSMNGLSSGDEGGGANHAIVGTLQQVGLSTAMAVPLGVLTGIYLVEYGDGKRLARVITFFVDVMTGIPSIVAGLFVMAFWLVALGFEYSGFAG